MPEVLDPAAARRGVTVKANFEVEIPALIRRGGYEATGIDRVTGKAFGQPADAGTRHRHVHQSGTDRVFMRRAAPEGRAPQHETRKGDPEERIEPVAQIGNGEPRLRHSPVENIQPR